MEEVTALETQKKHKSVLRQTLRLQNMCLSCPWSQSLDKAMRASYRELPSVLLSTKQRSLSRPTVRSSLWTSSSRASVGRPGDRPLPSHCEGGEVFHEQPPER